MKKTFFVSILILAFCVSAFSQENACPTVTLTNPPGIAKPNEPMIFTAAVTGWDTEKYPLEYEWFATGGKIVDGQGTLIVKIVAPDSYIDVTVTFKIKGLPPNCVTTLSERVYQPHEPGFSLINETPACPKISIKTTQGVAHFGSVVTFVAEVNPASSDKYVYKWKENAGNIEGQGTSVIKIRADKGSMNLQVTVEVTGLPQNCPNTASEIVPVTADETFAFPIESYGKISFREEKAKLDSIAVYLKNDDPFVFIFVIEFGEKDDINQLKNRISNISRYLLEKHKIPKNKFKFLFGESGFYETSVHPFRVEAAKNIPPWEQSIKQLQLRKRTAKKPAAFF